MYNKKHKTLALWPLLLALLLPVLFSGCGQEQETDALKQSYEEYVDSGMRFGVQSGDISDQLAKDIFHAEEDQISYFTAVSDLMAALDQGRVDAVILSEDFAKSLRGSGAYPNFGYLEVPEEVYVKESGPIFHTEELRDEYNKWLAQLKADGTWQEISDFWISDNLPDAKDIPKHELTGENGTLVMADTANFPPLTYVGDGGELLGMDADIMGRFAQHMGMNLEFQVMAYDAIFPAVASGKVDASAATYALTDERQEGMIFGDATVVTQAMLVVPHGGSAAAEDAVTYKDFIGQRIAILTGTIYDKVAEDLFEAKEVVYYNTVPEMFEAIKKKKVDAMLDDASYSIAMLSEPINKDFSYVEVPKDLLSFPIATIANNQDYVDKYNAFLAELAADGTLDELKKRWFVDFDVANIPEMPEIPLTGEGTLTVVTDAQTLQFNFVGADNELMGYTVELAHRFAQYLNVGKIDFLRTDFAAMVPAVASGKADISAAPLFITEERKQHVLFTDPIYQDGAALVYLPEIAEGLHEEANKFDFTTWLKEGIERNLITEDRYKMILDGLVVTMEIAVLAQIFGTVLGCLVCFLLMRKHRLPRGAAEIYSGLIHGTPMVVLLMIAYYIIFAKSPLNPIYIAVAAFAMVEGAHIGGNLKTAISTIDSTEIEAARSMGFSSIGAFFTVTLPQAIKVMLPGYMNGFVELTKATAIVGYIAIQDLSRAGDIIRSRTYDPYFPLLLVALIYLVITTICIKLFQLVIRRASK